MSLSSAMQVLAEAESREQKLVGAEESLARRRKEAEREHKAALTDAQAAVRRLQVISTCIGIFAAHAAACARLFELFIAPQLLLVVLQTPSSSANWGMCSEHCNSSPALP